MKTFNKLNRRTFFIVLNIFILSLIGISCSKDGNPNSLNSVDPSNYGTSQSDGVIRILAIGNSFSEDAIESNLYELAKEKNITLIIGNMYIAGASLGLHKQNIDRNASIYEYRKINKDGVKKTYNKTSIATAVLDEYWDYISFQQVSENSGQLETVESNLQEIITYVKSKIKNPEAKYLYHQTWAYAKNSTHAGFANYDQNQLVMYNAITNVSKALETNHGIDKIIPSGTAIQNGRTSIIGDNFTRDGYHLSIPLGRYLAACTWFESLFNISSVGMQYVPEGVSSFEASIAQNAAHMAMENPFSVTTMTDFQTGLGGPLVSPVFLDFGNGTASPSWNQINSFLDGTSITLKDSLNSYVGITLNITKRFNAVNTDGATATTTSFNMPSNVSRNSYFGNSKAAFNGIIITSSEFVLSGLDKNLSYKLCFFGSRNGVSDNRETKYTCIGTNTVSQVLNTSNNSTNIVCVNAIKPDSEGRITVEITSGDNNNNGNGFYYLSAARISSE